MKSYVMTTGGVFGLLVVAHIWRVIVEPQMLHDPWWFLTTLVAAALCFWAVTLVRSSTRA